MIAVRVHHRGRESIACGTPWWLAALARRLVPGDVAYAVRLWNGRSATVGTGRPRFTLVVRSPRALATLLLRPSLLALGEAFIDGAIDVEGDLRAAAAAAYALAGATGTWQPDADRSADALAAHYDVSPAFYEFFLDRRMLYTCAYYPHGDETLDEAQEAKLALVCRKLGVQAGHRLLDVGCGWGGMLAWAAERHAVRGHGITLSAAQAAWAAGDLDRRGLRDRVTVERVDWQTAAPEVDFDRIVAMGVLEHVGVARYPAFFGRIRRWLRRDGLVLVQSITHPTTSPRTSGMAFLDRHVFRGGDLASVDHVVAEMTRAGLAVMHVEALGPHYVRTTRDWLARLQARRRDAADLVGDRAYRIWTAYLAAASVAFAEGWIDVHQVVARRP